MSTKDKILDAAENFIRTQGFNSFSFRDVAAAIGIKSASVHYHFPTKDDLGEAVTDRYSANILASLEAEGAESTAPAIRVDAFIGIYRGALKDARQMCLCGMLGAEIESLGDPVKAAVRRFFQAQENWLASFLRKTHPEQDDEVARARARSAVAALQGALIMARTMDDHSVFEDVAARIRTGLIR
ncbi:MAG: TetR/AcrR family transcriptional regulator [Alphaproteobacteria bacterium]|nr:TetR/AcrR family transcriptional regulator [Alphaproteobacteria bacterium]